MSSRLAQLIAKANGKGGARKRASALKHEITVRTDNGKTVTVKLTDEGLEQYNTAEWMRLYRLSFLHIPNEGRRNPREGLALKILGLTPNASDFLIFTIPPRFPHAPGVCLEMKSLTGKATPGQTEWLAGMASLGWITKIAQGANEAINFLEWLGYNRRLTPGGGRQG
jgi:hypothetical protein